jgi:hypothetical protein
VGNVLDGEVSGAAVQAGSVRGGIHFHQPPAEDGRFPVPRQVPGPPATFVNRGPELDTLDLTLGDVGSR